MTLCLQSQCFKVNPDNTKFCQYCGKPLLLKDRYRPVELLGQGGFGKTFIALDCDKPSQPKCVIKQCSPQLEGSDSSGVAKAEALFAEEAKHLEQLGNHDQIPELYAYFMVEKQQYLVQEYVRGQTLTQELTQEGVFSQNKIEALLRDLLPVLGFIHRIPVIHRDIKPDNIIRRESDRSLVLVDFGAAKRVTPTNRSITGTVIGTAEYVAQEQMAGKPKEASDIYSLGVTCLHLLTGVSPFNLFDTEEFEWVWRDFLVNNPVDQKLGAVLDKMVCPGTKKRYQSTQAVLDALGEVKPDNQSFSSQQQVTVPSQTNSSLNKNNVSWFAYESVTVDQQGQIIKRTPGQAKYYREDLGHGVYLDMVYIAPGSFVMGEAASHNDTERPTHRVNVPQFWMGKYQVTQAQWEVIMGNNPAKLKGANRPIERVTWNNCQEFCQRLSKQTGKRYRLPSEAEWEYVCRAGTKTFFYSGTIITRKLVNIDGFSRDGLKKTTDVGHFPPNLWGIYDMHGNVWEWCQDSWHGNYQGAPTDGSAWIDNSSQTSSRVLRGGSWSSQPDYCRSASRGRLNRDLSDALSGFRLAME